MITVKMETILTEAIRSLQWELHPDDEGALPEADLKRMRRLITRMGDIVGDSIDERGEIELADAASAGATETVAPPVKVTRPVSDLQARAELLYPGMTKRHRK
jgi:hypothetical protein